MGTVNQLGCLQRHAQWEEPRSETVPQQELAQCMDGYETTSRQAWEPQRPCKKDSGICLQTTQESAPMPMLPAEYVVEEAQ